MPCFLDRLCHELTRDYVPDKTDRNTCAELKVMNEAGNTVTHAVFSLSCTLASCSVLSDFGPNSALSTKRTNSSRFMFSSLTGCLGLEHQEEMSACAFQVQVDVCLSIERTWHPPWHELKCLYSQAHLCACTLVTGSTGARCSSISRNNVPALFPVDEVFVASFLRAIARAATSGFFSTGRNSCVFGFSLTALTVRWC